MSSSSCTECPIGKNFSLENRNCIAPNNTNNSTANNTGEDKKISLATNESSPNNPTKNQTNDNNSTVSPTNSSVPASNTANNTAISSSNKNNSTPISNNTDADKKFSAVINSTNNNSSFNTTAAN